MILYSCLKCNALFKLVHHDIRVVKFYKFFDVDLSESSLYMWMVDYLVYGKVHCNVAFCLPYWFQVVYILLASLLPEKKTFNTKRKIPDLQILFYYNKSLYDIAFMNIIGKID